MKILVSKCLTGCPCRYDGKSCGNEKVTKFLSGHQVFAVCPEQDGGLSTPRSPAEIIGDKIIAKNGNDVTKEYTLGAQKALQVAKENNVDLCILKAKSPSCGKSMIYDGTFSGNLIEGNGVTCKLLQENGFKVISENEI